MPKFFETGRRIGGGREKEVFADANSPDHVIGVYKAPHDKKSPEYVKGQFYLTKILHALFPNHVADISRSTTTPRTTRRKRIDSIDPLGVTANQEGDSVESRLDFLKEAADAGLFIDNHMENFVMNKQYDYVYVDDIYPWGPDGKRLYDLEKLLRAIMSRLSGQEQERALTCLERLEKLYAEFSKTSDGKGKEVRSRAAEIAAEILEDKARDAERLKESMKIPDDVEPGTVMMLSYKLRNEKFLLEANQGTPAERERSTKMAEDLRIERYFLEYLQRQAVLSIKEMYDAVQTQIIDVHENKIDQKIEMTAEDIEATERWLRLAKDLQRRLLEEAKNQNAAK